MTRQGAAIVGDLVTGGYLKKIPPIDPSPTVTLRGAAMDDTLQNVDQTDPA